MNNDYMVKTINSLIETTIGRPLSADEAVRGDLFALVDDASRQRSLLRSCETLFKISPAVPEQDFDTFLASRDSITAHDFAAFLSGYNPAQTSPQKIQVPAPFDPWQPSSPRMWG